MKSSEAVEKRDVRTTYLVFDWDSTDWDLFQSKCYLVRYPIPRKHKKDWEYYARMHNWYKEVSDYPCYLHTYGPYLYVKYPTCKEVKSLYLKDNPHPLIPEEVQLRDKSIFHAIIKVLLSDFFLVDGKFVSNSHFFIRATSAEESFITGLEINISQNWRKPEEFAIKDDATRLRKLLPTQMEGRNWWRYLHYGRFYQDGMVIFKQLKPSAIGPQEKDEGIYVEYRNQEHRASITFHSVSSLEALEETRSYLLSNFLSKLITYFQRYGLRLHQKTLEMQRISNLHGKQMEARQIPIDIKKVFVIDDRWNQKEPTDTFLAGFTNVANSIIGNGSDIFEGKNRSEIRDGDLVLRLQDYGEEDFSAENGLLKNSNDPKHDFYQSLPNVVKQTININPNTEVRQRERRKPKKGSGIDWNLERYFSYPFPKSKDESFRLKLEVCLNQLILKDIVMFPANAVRRLPQLMMMADKVFMDDGYLTYLDGNTLRFLPIINNFDNGAALVRELTGKDLLEDVLIPSIEYSKPNPEIDSEEIDKALSRRFILCNDYVFEIRDNDGRMLYEDLEIRDRFEKLEEDIPTKLFYPKFPLTGKEPFTEQQLRDYSDFLDEYVLEPFISFSDLKMKYGTNVRDSNGSILIEGGGFYRLLGIQKDTKFRAYLQESLGLKFESVRDQTVIPVYQGIWYDPETQQYLVGSKDGRNFDQEKGFVFRQVICHSEDLDSDKMFDILRKDFFPMLEVNFIRFRNYTVYPFPFKLIEIWRDVTEQ